MQYDKNFKLEALALSDDIGVRRAAERLNIPYYTLAEWRTKRRHLGDAAFVGSGNKQLSPDEKDRRIQEQDVIIKDLMQQVEILQDALGFFAARRKK